MKTKTEKLKNKVISSFKNEMGFDPKVIKIDGEIVLADGFWCRLVNGVIIKKTHGLAWRLDNA